MGAEVGEVEARFTSNLSLLLFSNPPVQWRCISLVPIRETGATLVLAVPVMSSIKLFELL